MTDVKQFTHSRRLFADGAVTFQCSADREAWPWLALDPFDPIVVQTINFWAASGASAMRRTHDPKKWTALTHTEWTCGDPGAGHATHGVAEPDGAEGSPGFRLTLFDANGALVYRMNGTGVVFQNRDFEAWRRDTKREIVQTIAPEDFDYADAETLGVVAPGLGWLSRLTGSKTPSAQGLITRHNGFPPGHPYLSGSGDHVNATHLAESARQFASLLGNGETRRCIAGAMQFDRFVELGAPFRIELGGEQPNRNRISVAISQAGQPCATIALTFA